ncbi:Gmad2 immunoglobulin-like domain-containing protein [Nocardioides sp. B-3]|uniref:Gmad2 immunoglobulin-like domain-containing protein n=1 Tax=Nocardioides sp. B-3 TaxID=2895565 RepID=UPI002152AD0A|nr:Gmad2 immunoglobulin-like domain-containing protein [Nocardioides sp. B-3]UUZ58516.1 GerMN domain-containing protein [Nocardioides sp. B-3]
MTSPTHRLAALLSLGALAPGATACSEEVPDRAPTPVSNESEATDPAASPTETPTETESPEGEGTVTVPVYFVGETPQGPRLFREFRAVPSDNPLREALALMLAGDTLDPDYRTLWPQVEISSVGATDGVLLVQMPGDGFTERPDGMSKYDARLALQQLVHTLRGVQQERVPVVIKRGGTDFRLFGLSTETEFTNADALDVMSLVNITTPEQGATVTGGTLEASGVGSSFEANLLWEIRQGDRGRARRVRDGRGLDGQALPVGDLDRRLRPRARRLHVRGPHRRPVRRRRGLRAARGHQGLLAGLIQNAVNRSGWSRVPLA